MTLSVLAAVRNGGLDFPERVRAWVRSVSDLDVEIVVVDNMSVDGCCHGLPREVLIVRTGRIESPTRLWRLGGSLASGRCLLWLHHFQLHSPDQFRALVLAALEIWKAEQSSKSARGTRTLRFSAARRGPAVLTPKSRSRLEGWENRPRIGAILAYFAARALPLFTPLHVEGNERPESPDEGAPRQPDAPLDEVRLQETQTAKSASPSPTVERGAGMISVIITAHNEGDEVLRTVDSVLTNTRSNYEIIMIDDASTDGSCAGLEELGVRVIRHSERVGVAFSRDEGSRAAFGDVFAYLDAHQRVDSDCLDRCAKLARAHAAIICPPCRPLEKPYPVTYGASLILCPERGFLSSRCRIIRPRHEITRISGLRSPGYLIPRGAYARLAWTPGLRGWGATDYCLALKAFFSDVDIFLANAGATHHLFRRHIPYPTSWEGVWRNQALIIRVCFDERTWTRYWLPEVFQKNLSDDVLQELRSPAVVAEHEAFMAVKVRPDREFWRGLLRVPEPKALL